MYVGFIRDHFFLLSTDSTYSRVPGDKGGPIFFRQEFFSALVLCTNWCTTICITCPILRKIECIKLECNEFVLVLVQIDLIQFEKLLLGHLWSQNDVITSWLRLTANLSCCCIHIRHKQSVWAHWYGFHGHTVAALKGYTHTSWLRFWGSGSLLESKWCHYFMVEADSQLKLLPLSTLDMYAKCLNTLICCP